MRRPRRFDDPRDDPRRALEAAIAERGHAGYGCTVRTTAELLLALLPGWQFERELDTATGYAELVVRRRHADRAGNDIT